MTRPQIRGIGLSVLVGWMTITLAGCGAEAASPPTPAPVSTPTTQPTVVLGFAVETTPVAAHVRPRPRPTARPTQIPLPGGPYLLLNPRIGPPTSRTIWVRGGHLPPDETVTIAWAPHGNTSPVSTTGYTGPHGGLRAQFTVPGSPPGTYHVVAVIGGVPYAAAQYRVVSAATITVTAAPGIADDRLRVSGRHFLPHLRLLLISYAMSGKQKPVVVGPVRTNARGSFSATKIVKALPAGQYVLRAAALDSYAAQVADAFFQIVM